MCSSRDLLKYFRYVNSFWILCYLLKITKYIGNTNLCIFFLPVRFLGERQNLDIHLAPHLALKKDFMPEWIVKQRS